MSHCVQMTARSFLVADSKLRGLMREQGSPVHTARWQGQDVSTRPEAEMRELLNVTMSVDMRGISALEHWRLECRPNLPWADEHFLERVCGEPLNPPPSWVRWPWANAADRARTTEGGKFNHTYPERYWPKHAGHGMMDNGVLCTGTVTRGIRHEYGDLGDVVDLLVKEPDTRQAYLPMFFPEDTGVGDGGRKPCTLGYQFIVREQRLHCYYPMRSCDLMRHYRDDVYLAVRLMLWVIDECREREDGTFWDNVRVGSLTMHMTSLHCFINDLRTL